MTDRGPEDRSVKYRWEQMAMTFQLIEVLSWGCQ